MEVICYSSADIMLLYILNSNYNVIITWSCHNQTQIWAKNCIGTGRPAPIQSGCLIGWLARTIELFFTKRYCHEGINYYFPTVVRLLDRFNSQPTLSPYLPIIVFCGCLKYHQNRSCVPSQRILLRQLLLLLVYQKNDCTDSTERTGCAECTGCNECSGVIKSQY